MPQRWEVIVILWFTDHTGVIKHVYAYFAESTSLNVFVDVIVFSIWSKDLDTAKK